MQNFAWIVSYFCPGIGLGLLGKVGKQAVDELLLLFFAVAPGVAYRVGHICTFLHVLVQRHQHLMVLLQEHKNIQYFD